MGWRRAAVAFALPAAAALAATAGSGALPPHGGGGCADEWGCALGGTCTASKCACDPWFTGGNCALLNLQPAKPGNGFDLGSWQNLGAESFSAPGKEWARTSTSYFTKWGVADNSTFSTRTKHPVLTRGRFRS